MYYTSEQPLVSLRCLKKPYSKARRIFHLSFFGYINQEVNLTLISVELLMRENAVGKRIPLNKNEHEKSTEVKLHPSHCNRHLSLQIHHYMYHMCFF